MSCLYPSAIPLPLLQSCLRPIPRRSFLFQKQTPYFCPSGNFKTFHIDCIFAEKRVQYMVYFLFGSSPGAAVRKSIEEFFCSLYSRCTRFCIAAGDTVTGISKAYQSYTSAVISLQSSFFFPTGTFCLLFYQAPVSETAAELSASPENEFLTLLTEKK